MALVSVIVPIYNAGNALIKLLDSLCNQTLRDIEILCVLDCPTDNSDKVCFNYALKDKRIITIPMKNNVGIAACRNRGIEEAIRRNSQYIGFADHDDFLELSALEEMYNAANDNVNGGFDILFSNTVIHEDKTKSNIYFNDATWNGMIKSLLLPMNSKANPNYLVRSVWNSIYKTQFIKDFQIRFLDRKLYFEEDTLFNLCAYTLTTNIKYLNKFTYNWVKHEMNTSNLVYTHQEETEKLLRFLFKEWEILNSNKLYEFNEYFYIMISYFLRRYYEIIKKTDSLNIEVSKLLRECKFPVFGKYEDMKIVSKIRIKLLFFVFYLKFIVK